MGGRAQTLRARHPVMIRNLLTCPLHQMEVTLKVLKSLIILAITTATLGFGQANEGSLRVFITDANGRTAETPIHITSPANQFDKNLTSNSDGTLTIFHLPY